MNRDELRLKMMRHLAHGSGTDLGFGIRFGKHAGDAAVKKELRLLVREGLIWLQRFGSVQQATLTDLGAGWLLRHHLGDGEQDWRPTETIPEDFYSM